MKTIVWKFAVLLGMFIATQTFAQIPGEMPFGQTERSAVIETLSRQLRQRYVFPEIGEKTATILADKAAHGAYQADVTPGAFALSLSHDLREAANDRHLRVEYLAQNSSDSMGGPQPRIEVIAKPQSEAGTNPVGAAVPAPPRGPPTMREPPGTARSEVLAGNVGYLDLRGFRVEDADDATYAATLQSLANTDALILDLRRNGGGVPDAIATLLSHFFALDDRRHLNDLRWRDGRHDEFWTHRVAAPYYLKPIYVLTSARTFSGGEECAYDLQTQKRGILVGEVTGGGANPGAMFDLGQGFAAFIPNGYAINPVTKTNWESVGVKPDIAVRAVDALNTAYAAILKQRIEDVHDALQRDRLRELLTQVEQRPSEQTDYSAPFH